MERLPMIGLDQIRQAAERLAPWVHRTPVLTSRTLDERTGSTVFFKCENFQRIGAFKFRGAMNALLTLDDDAKRRGVVTHSSGNHAQALALAGRTLSVRVCIVMPRTAPAVKRQATASYGAEVVSCEPTLADREATVNRLITEYGYHLVHPYDDWSVIAGQGTAAWELLDEVGMLDAVITPVGGGGLLAGTAITVKGRSPSTQVIGAEPKEADDALRSLLSGRIEPSLDPKTIADGLRTSLGERPFSVIGSQVDTIATASEFEILDAMRFLFERMKIVVEPSGCLPLAVLFNGQVPTERRRIGLILSGGNVDPEPLLMALRSQIASRS
jgi:threonine dehydratase